MKLYCMRHGEACSLDIDPFCGLTEHGRAEVTRLANYLARCDVQIDQLLHSDKDRAVQTAQIVAQALGIEQLTVSDTLLQPMAEITAVFEMVQAMTDNTLLVGHLPFMGDLVNALVTSSPQAASIINFSPGTMVCLERCGADQSWVINWVLRPAMVPEG